jgi:hypothetical protein
MEWHALDMVNLTYNQSQKMDTFDHRDHVILIQFVASH